MAVAAGLRFYQLGRPSLWYDEVVSMRLATSPDPMGLLRMLGEIDATRAPLHPLALQGWLKLVGPTEWRARAFSASFGLATVVFVYLIGRAVFDQRTALFAGWLAAVCPALVRYSQEVRMYALLTFLSCVLWWLLTLPRSRRFEWVFMMIFEVLVFYCHPLGLFMLAIFVPLSFLYFWRSGRGLETWLIGQGAVALAVLPWLPRYFDHPPESAVGRLPPRFLLGLPIEYIGGDFRSLALAVVVIAVGAYGARGAGDPERRWWGLLAWFVVPPVLLYAYSQVSHPIFGPARYTLFVAPAFLLLVGRGLARLPLPLAVILLVGSSWLSALMLSTMVYDPGLKADWRAAAIELGHGLPTKQEVVAVASADPARNAEVETAKYYLGPRYNVVAAEGRDEAPDVFAVGTRGGRLAAPLPDFVTDEWTRRDLHGLALYFRSAP